MTRPINFPLNRGALNLTPQDIISDGCQYQNFIDIPSKVIFVYNINSDNRLVGCNGWSRQLMEYYKARRSSKTIEVEDVGVNIRYYNSCYNTDGELVDGWSNYYSNDNEHYFIEKLYNPLKSKIVSLGWENEPLFVILGPDIPHLLKPTFYGGATYSLRNLLDAQFRNNKMHKNDTTKQFNAPILSYNNHVPFNRFQHLINENLANNIGGFSDKPVYIVHLLAGNLNEAKRLIDKSVQADNTSASDISNSQFVYESVAPKRNLGMQPIRIHNYEYLLESIIRSKGMEYYWNENDYPVVYNDNPYFGETGDNMIHLSMSIYAKGTDDRGGGVYTGNLTPVSRVGNRDTYPSGYIYSNLLRYKYDPYFSGEKYQGHASTDYEIDIVNNVLSVVWNIDPPETPFVLEGHIPYLIKRAKEGNIDEFDVEGVSPYIRNQGGPQNHIYMIDGTILTANDVDFDISGSKCKVIWYNESKRPNNDYYLPGTLRMRDLQYYNNLSYKPGGFHYQMWSGSAVTYAMHPSKYWKDTSFTCWSQIDRADGATVMAGHHTEPGGPFDFPLIFAMYYMSGIPFGIAINLVMRENFTLPVGDPLCNPFKNHKHDFSSLYEIDDTYLTSPINGKGTWDTGRKNV